MQDECVNSYHPVEPMIHEQESMVDLLDRIPDGVFDNIVNDSDQFTKQQKDVVFKSKLRKFTNRQRKAFTAEVITHARRLELKTYELCRRWKRDFRYDLVSDFRSTVSSVRRRLIYGYTVDKKFKDEKIFQYNQAQCELDELESIMWLMIQPSINVMSNIEWVEFAYEVDTINNMLDKLLSSLKRSEPESKS